MAAPDEVEGVLLPQDAKPQLHLSRFAGTATNGAVKVEEQGGGLRGDEVVVVEQVENIQHWLDRPVAEVEVLRQPEVEAVEVVVLLSQVALSDRAVPVDAFRR